MAHIPESEIERLKQEVSLERVVAVAGIELKRHGVDLLGLCPFHDDQCDSAICRISQAITVSMVQ